jgi:hypothetical protein
MDVNFVHVDRITRVVARRSMVILADHQTYILRHDRPARNRLDPARWIRINRSELAQIDPSRDSNRGSMANSNRLPGWRPNRWTRRYASRARQTQFSDSRRQRPFVLNWAISPCWRACSAASSSIMIRH